MKIKKSLLGLFLLFVIVVFVFSAFKVNALNMKANDVIYFVDTNDWGVSNSNAKLYVHLWNSSTGDVAFGWQDDKGRLTDTETDVCDSNGDCHNVYKFDISSEYGDKYDMIIFSASNVGTGSSFQTKNLSYPGPNTIFTIYENSIQNGDQHGRYSGEWLVYDRTELQELVNEASKIDVSLYTNATATTFTNALDAAKLVISTIYPRNEEEMANYKDVIVNADGSSSYDSLLSNLRTAMNGLVEKNKISVSTPVGGSVSIDSYYFEDNETINFKLIPINEGYEPTFVRVIKVTGYDGNVPILSTKEEDITNLDINDTGIYSYVAGTDDIYIDVAFNIKEYTITTTVGDLGTIDPNGPITVEHGTGKEFTITAKEGYNIKGVTVNGKDYVLKDNKLTLTDITEDMEVVVTFEINTYVVKVDGVDYRISHGSLLSDLSSYNNIITRNGYKFEGFKLAGTDKEFDLNTKITSDIELETEFTLIPVEPEEDLEGGMGVVGPDTGNLNPNTSDSIVYTFVAMVISMVAMIGMLYYRRKKLVKEKVDLI